MEMKLYFSLTISQLIYARLMTIGERKLFIKGSP